MSSYPGPSVDGEEKVRERGRKKSAGFPGRGWATSWAVLRKGL